MREITRQSNSGPHPHLGIILRLTRVSISLSKFSLAQIDAVIWPTLMPKSQKKMENRRASTE
jgi:hypothetical protein